MTAFSDWMNESTTKQKQRLANAAKISVNYLYRIAAGDRTVSAEVAAGIEKGSERINDIKLPKLSRGDVSTICRDCSYFKKCNK